MNWKASTSELDPVNIVLSPTSSISRCSSDKLTVFSCLVKLICSDSWTRGLILVLSIVLHQLQCLIELLLLLIQNLAVISVTVLRLGSLEDLIPLLIPPETFLNVLLNCVKFLHHC